MLRPFGVISAQEGESLISVDGDESGVVQRLDQRPEPVRGHRSFSQPVTDIAGGAACFGDEGHCPGNCSGAAMCGDDLSEAEHGARNV